ncbi:hypothetical protein NJNGDCLN_02499 [Mannheimia haemolytica]
MNIKATLRKARLVIGKAILDSKNTDLILSEIPNKILFLRHDGKIGDYVVSSFVFREIKKQSPQTQIGVVCSQKNRYLFENNPYIDKLYLVKTKSIPDYIRGGKQLAKEQYDVVIDPTVTLRNRDLLFLRTISAKHYVDYQKQKYRLFDLNVEDRKQHFSEIYQDALALIGFENIETQYDVPLNATSNQSIKHYLYENQIRNYIALNLFGAGSARRFSEQKINELLSCLKQHSDKPIVLLTFPEVTAKLCSFTKKYKNIFVYEKTKSVFDSIELIRFADLLISPDTATVHIASGLSKKIIAFYSSDEQNFIHWHPNNQAETHILRFRKSVNDLDFAAIKPEWLK